MSDVVRGRRVESEQEAGGFPQVRLRRLRRTDGLRRMVRETSLSPSNLIYPLFVTHGRDVRTPITSMPGQFQLSLDHLLVEVAEVQDLGIPGVLLFGIPLGLPPNRQLFPAGPGQLMLPVPRSIHPL